MPGSDLKIPFPFAVDASPRAIGGVLFPLYSTPEGTEATAKFGNQERINLFFFY